ncbi:hypothetical protein OY671_008583, partial [Metschnikowia pulcherrima]
NVPQHSQNRNWSIEANTNGSGPREPVFKVNNISGSVRACQQGLGIAASPDYSVEDNNRSVQSFTEADSIQLDTYFVYPEELKSVARVQVFRDFIVSKAQRWPIPIALTIAGSDSSGGAGIQADLKTFAACGVYGASAITASTAQNTKGVTGIHDVPADFITAQIDAVFTDLDVKAV